MAHKKGLGSSRNGRDSNAQRLGFKAFGGQVVPGGTIIVRQRGTRVKPGLNVGRGKDDTLFAKISGRIKFMDKGSMGKFVMIEPLEAKWQSEDQVGPRELERSEASARAGAFLFKLPAVSSRLSANSQPSSARPGQPRGLSPRVRGPADDRRPKTDN